MSINKIKYNLCFFLVGTKFTNIVSKDKKSCKEFARNSKNIGVLTREENKVVQ